MSTPPTDAFVPLTAHSKAAGNGTEFRRLVVQSAEGVRPFRPQASPPTGRADQAGAKAGCEPQIALQREGDLITGIQIRCSCGEVIDLTCVYQAPAQ